MLRLGAPPNYMDGVRRQELLLQIAGTRAKEKSVLEVINSLPAWVEKPFKEDQAAADVYLQSYSQAEPIVRNIESRLTLEPGPIWKDLTPEEQVAFTNWTRTVDQLYAFVSKYFPSESQQYVTQMVLLAIAAGAFIAPIFLDEPLKKISLPFGLEPPELPFLTSPKPREPEPSPPRGGALEPPPGIRRSFAPTSFSKIPGVPERPSAIRLQPEIMRPAVSTPAPWTKIPVRTETPTPTPPPVATPWRRMVEPTPPGPTAAPAAAPPGASPGFRRFTTPLGPETPPMRPQPPAEAAPPFSAPPISPRAPMHGPPRFRRS